MCRRRWQVPFWRLITSLLCKLKNFKNTILFNFDSSIFSIYLFKWIRIFISLFLFEFEFRAGIGKEIMLPSGDQLTLAGGVLSNNFEEPSKIKVIDGFRRYKNFLRFQFPVFSKFLIFLTKINTKLRRVISNNAI